MTQRHAGKHLLSHLGDERGCSLNPRNGPRFYALAALDNGSSPCRESAQGLSGVVAARLSLLSVKKAVEPHGLASQVCPMRGEGDELDPASHEALDIQHVQALVEPVDEEVDRVDSVGPDGACLPLLDRARIHAESEDPEPNLSKGVLEGGALPAHTPAAVRLEVGKARAQD